MKNVLLPALAACLSLTLADRTVWSEPPDANHSAEVLAIQQSASAFREAFNRADAKAVAALWTVDGQYIDEQGQRYEGREAIEKEYSVFFAAHPGAKIHVVVDNVRLLSPTTAIEDGRSVVEPAPQGAPATSRYTAVHVKLDGKWLLASVRDTRVETSSAHERLQDLEALIGDWTAEEHGAKLDVSCRWLGNKNFIERRYSVVRSGHETSSGVQIIGWDPLEERVQSWNFTSDGGHAVGVWAPHENGWTVHTRGVLSDGTPTSAVNTFTLIDRDALAWQSVQRVVAGSQLPDLDEIILKRKQPQP